MCAWGAAAGSERALLGLGCGAGAGAGSPPALGPPPDPPGQQTGHVVRGAPINLYAKKKYKPLQGLGQTLSKLRTFVLQCSRARH